MPKPNEIPSIAYLGMRLNDRQMVAFHTHEDASEWATKGGEGEQRLFWSVAIPDDVVVFEAEVVPAKVKVKEHKK